MAQTLPNGTVVPNEDGSEVISSTGVAELRTLGASVDAQLAGKASLTALEEGLADARFTKGRASSGGDVLAFPPGVTTIGSVTAAEGTANMPEAYPGTILTLGNTGEYVRAVLFFPYNRDYFWWNVIKPGAEWVGWQKVPSDTGGMGALGSGITNALLVQDFARRRGGVWSTGGKGAVSVRLDHGLANVRDKILPMFKSAGIVPSIALNARNWDRPENGGVTPAQVNAWVAAGEVEIWNHSATHGSADSETAIYDEVVNGLAELRAQLPAAQIDGWVIPGTGTDPYMGMGTVTSVQQLYGSYGGRLILEHHAVTTGHIGETWQRVLDGVVRQGQRHYGLDTRGFAEAKVLLDSAIANRTGLQLMLHPSVLDTAGSTTTAQLQQIVDYIVQKRNSGELVVCSPYKMMLANSGVFPPTAHNHDDRYYTETETDQKLAGKVDTSDARLTDARTPVAHSHAQGDVTGLVAALAGKRNVEAIELDPGADANNLTTPGIYIETYAFEAAQNLNFPENADGALKVEASSTRVRVEQTWRGFSSGKRFERSRNSGVWSAWEEVVKGTDPRLSDSRTPKAHTHATGDVTGLQSALDAKVGTTDPRLSDARTPTAHSHTTAQVTGLDTALGAKADKTDPRFTDARTPTAHTHPWDQVTSKPTTFTPAAHQHPVGDVTGLQAALDSKASTTDPRLTDARTPLAHQHPQADVTGLAAALDAKSNVAPVVMTGNGIDLDTYKTTFRGVVASNTWAINGLHFPDPTAGYFEVVNAPNGFVWQIYRTYSISDPKFFIRTWWNSWGPWRMLITDRHPALNDYRYPLAHKHAVEDVTGLQTALDAAGVAEHTHPIAEVEGLTQDLAAKLEAGDLDEALAGVASAYDVAVADGFTGSVSEWLASLVGPRGAEGPYGGTVVTDPQVAQLVMEPTETQAALDSRYQWAVRPVDYGAVGDGVADDTASVAAAVASGLPVHWGDGTYRITAPIETTLAGPLVWRSEGATILGDFPSPVARMVDITAQGHPVTITGGITLDAARTAFTVIRAWNRGDASPACIIEDLTVLNGYRSSQEHQGGDGIQIGGSWDRVALIRPTVKHQNLAAGAGISGQYGVGGIYVHDINVTGGAESPHIVHIEDPYIEDVSSEDPAHLVDQDAIKVFGGLAADGDTAPMRTHATITGGEIRNAMGRAVKSQVEMTTVDGLRIVRTRGGKGAAHDIDFQVGGGTLRNLEAVYVNAAPQSVVNFSGTRTAGRALTQKQVSGVKVLIQGSVAPDQIVSLISYDEADFRATLSDITVLADSTHPAHIVRMSGPSGAIQRVVLAGVIAHPTTACVAAQGGSPDGWDGTLVVTGAVNPGPARPLLAAQTLARVTATHASLVGYTV